MVVPNIYVLFSSLGDTIQVIYFALFYICQVVWNHQPDCWYLLLQVIAIDVDVPVSVGIEQIQVLLKVGDPLHPWKLTWNLKITQLKRNIIFQTSIFGFHVSFRGCKRLLQDPSFSDLRWLLGTVPTTLLTRWGGKRVRRGWRLVFLGRAQGFRGKEHGEHGNGTFGSTDSTHFAHAFCLKKLISNILHDSFVLVSFHLLCHVLHI